MVGSQAEANATGSYGRYITDSTNAAGKRGPLSDTAREYNGAFVAKNARKIGEVDKTRPGIFLYNYFYASDPDVVLPVWEYTARWFVCLLSN